MCKRNVLKDLDKGPSMLKYIVEAIVFAFILLGLKLALGWTPAHGAELQSVNNSQSIEEMIGSITKKPVKSNTPYIEAKAQQQKWEIRHKAQQRAWYNEEMAALNAANRRQQWGKLAGDSLARQYSEIYGPSFVNAYNNKYNELQNSYIAPLQVDVYLH